MNVSLFLLHFPVYALGPGTRAGVWFQGCKRRCPGCVAPESWDFLPESAVPLENVVARLKEYLERGGASMGLTVSGGEPFDQPEALLELLRRVKEMKVRDVLVYSGYRAEELAERRPEFFAEGLVAALVDGPFERGNGSDAVWKGSDNQTLTLWDESLAPRYLAWARETARRLQWPDAPDFPGSRRCLIGIPRQADVPRLTETLGPERFRQRDVR